MPRNDTPERTVWLMALAETCVTRKQRKRFYQALKNPRSANSNDRLIQGPLAILEHLQQNPAVIREYFEVRRRASECKASFYRSFRYPMVVLILGILAFSTFGLSMSMMYSLSRGSEDVSLISLTGGSPTQTATASMLQHNLLTFTRGFPAFFTFLLMSALLFRFLGGPVIWGYAQSLLPWVGAFQRAHCTSELFHGVALLLQQKVSLSAAFRLAGQGSTEDMNRILGLAISEDLRQGKSLIESLAMRSWYPSWLIDYLYQASDQQPLSDSLKHLANLLESQALTRCQTVVRVVPQVLFCILVLFLQYGYMTLTMDLLNLLQWMM